MINLACGVLGEFDVFADVWFRGSVKGFTMQIKENWSDYPIEEEEYENNSSNGDKVEIFVEGQYAGTGVYIHGKSGGTILDCPADLGEDVYTTLEREIFDVVKEKTEEGSCDECET